MDKFMKFSVGIGNNVQEAECNLKKAKQRKNQNLEYNIIESYNGQNQVIDMSNPIVESYLFLEQRLQQDKEGLEKLEVLKHDSLTGLLNKVGYAIEVNKLNSIGLYNSRIIIYLDGDGLHELNAEYGYEKVDELINLSGKALKNISRKETESLDKKARNVDILNHRTHDSCGDEFLIDICCKPEYALNVTKRYLDAMYQAQSTIQK
jgi:GGDEF domain-containing protein